MNAFFGAVIHRKPDSDSTAFDKAGFDP